MTSNVITMNIGGLTYQFRPPVLTTDCLVFGTVGDLDHCIKWSRSILMDYVKDGQKPLGFTASTEFMKRYIERYHPDKREPVALRLYGEVLDISQEDGDVCWLKIHIDHDVDTELFTKLIGSI